MRTIAPVLLLVLILVLVGTCEDDPPPEARLQVDGDGGAGGAIDGSGGTAGIGGDAGGPEAQGGSGGQGGAATGGGEPGSGGAGGTGAGNGGSGGEGGMLEPGPTIILSGLDGPRLLKCDGSHLYWIDNATGDVHRAELDGFGEIIIATGAALGASEVELDGSNLLYRIQGASGRIVSVPLSGATPSTIVTAPDIRDVATYAGTIYWNDVSSIYTTSGPVFTTTYTMRSIAIDASGMYFIEGDTNGAWHVPFGSATPRRLGVSAPPTYNTLHLDPEYAVWGTTDALVRAPKGVGVIETLAPIAASQLDVAAGVYVWITSFAVYAKREGMPHREVAPLNIMGGITLCAGYMYWASYDDNLIARAAP